MKADYYRIVNINEISHYLSLGWLLYGSPFVKDGVICQAIIKIEEE